MKAKKDPAKERILRESEACIEFGIRLTSRSFPHILNVKLTESQKTDLINLHSNKRYVDYCAKFEEYFLINRGINNGKHISEPT